MKVNFLFFLFFFLLSSCATDKPNFSKENVCPNQALKYLKNPRNKYKQLLNNPELIQAMADTSRSMQLCYEDFKNRTGHEEFNTCLVVGVDENSSLEYFNFGSQEIKLDYKFLKCAQAVTQTVPFNTFGSNYILIQSYQFYVGN